MRHPPTGVTVDLSNNANNAGGDAAGDKLSLVENLLGSEHDDSLTGDGNANVLEGGKGADTLAGGGGIDTASYAGSDAGVTVDLANSANNAGGDAAGDVLSGFENLIGSAQDDDLRGDNGNNRIDGGCGLRHPDAGAGNDTLLGGDGWRHLHAGRQSDQGRPDRWRRRQQHAGACRQLCGGPDLHRDDGRQHRRASCSPTATATR